MPDATFRATFVFEGAEGGWTETWYRTGADAQAVMDACYGHAGYVPARRACLSKGAILRYVRVSNVDPPRDALFRSNLGATGEGQLGAAPAAPADGGGAWGDGQGLEQIADAVNMRCFAGRTVWRSFLMRGLPSVAFRQDGTLRSAGPFLTALTAFQTMLKGGWLLKSTVVDDVASQFTINACTGFNFAIDGFGVTGASFALLTTSKKVRVSQVNTVGNANGLWRVLLAPTASPGTVRVYRKPRKNFGDFATASGFLRLMKDTYSGCTDFAIIGVTTRRAGRFLYRPRGRQSVRGR